MIAYDYVSNTDPHYQYQINELEIGGVSWISFMNFSHVLPFILFLPFGEYVFLYSDHRGQAYCEGTYHLEDWAHIKENIKTDLR